MGNLFDKYSYDETVEVGSQKLNNPTAADCKMAAWRAVEDWGATLRGAVFRFIHIQGERGATSEEIEAALGKKSQSITPRITELSRGDEGKYPKMIRSNGETRETVAGKEACVYISLFLGNDLPKEGDDEKGSTGS